MTNVQLAVIHEFGAPSVGIPARSFIRAPFDAKRNDYLQELRKHVRGVYEGRAFLHKVLSIMGLKMEWDQKNAVLQGEGIPPPLADSTIKAKERKGRWNTAAKEAPRPLVDTGRLVASISHAVVGVGGEGGEGGK
jgi:phage gpG-like protein